MIAGGINKISPPASARAAKITQRQMALSRRRTRYASHRASGGNISSIVKVLAIASAVNIAVREREAGAGRRTLRRKNSTCINAHSSATEYIRASCPYLIKTRFTAKSTAANGAVKDGGVSPLSWKTFSF